MAEWPDGRGMDEAMTQSTVRLREATINAASPAMSEAGLTLVETTIATAILLVAVAGLSIAAVATTLT